MKKLLLDENLPIDLRLYFSAQFEVYTVKYMGWESYQNGMLLTAMLNSNFHALITADKKLQYQQNLQKYQIRVIILDSDSTLLEHLKSFIPLVEDVLNNSSEELAVVIKK